MVYLLYLKVCGEKALASYEGAELIFHMLPLSRLIYQQNKCSQLVICVLNLISQLLYESVCETETEYLLSILSIQSSTAVVLC